MKYLDEVELVKNKKKYTDRGVVKGMFGTIIDAAIRDNSFLVNFCDNCFKNDDIIIEIKIEDLSLVQDGYIADSQILEDLPLNNPRWWCKVENGLIVNLLGEKKNKIPYDYNT